MRVRAAVVILMIGLATSVAVAAPAKLVYRIDRATATVVQNRLVIVARGAVSTGGWVKPLLRPREASALEAATQEVDFVATPPRHRAAVAHGIMPVSASLSAPPPRTGVVQVRIVSQTNSLTVPITRSGGSNGRSQAASATTRLRPVFLAR
jgi:hypothetical protein